MCPFHRQKPESPEDNCRGNISFLGGRGEALFQCSFILFLFLAFLFVCLSVFYLVWLVGLFLDGIVHACSFRES